MTAQVLDHAAQRIYETLAAAGHGPRPWAAHAPNETAWSDLPERWQDEYRQAARAAFEAGEQQVMPL